MMEWPGGRCRLTAVALLLVLLAIRHASAAARGADAGRKKNLAGGPVAREARRADLGISYSGASAHDNDTRSKKGKLKIAVPRKHGFYAFVKITHPNTDRQKVTGYSIEVFEAALEKLNSSPQYEFCVFDGTYDELVRNVSIGKTYDAAVGDVTITAERVMEAEFTMPYLQSGLSLLVRSKNDSKQIQWIFLEPLTKELWIATVGFFFFTGFIVWMIEHPRNPEYQGSRLRQLTNASYFAFSTLTFSHEPIIRSPLSKIVLVVWCFAVLVLVQSYTANLSSMLTAKRLQPSGTDLISLVRNGDYIGYQEETFTCSFLLKEGVPKKRIRALKDQTEYAEALRKGSKNGGVSAIVDEIPYLTQFLLDPQYKKEFEMVSNIYSYRTTGFGFVFSPGSPLVHNLSVAILELTQGYEILEIEDKWLSGAAQRAGKDSPLADSVPLTLQSFSGLFVITGCVLTLMLLIKIARSCYARHTRIQEDSCLQNSVGEGGSTNLTESNALQDDMGYGPVPDQSHSEDGSEHSIRAHGSSVDVGQEEPCRIHNGSMTADAIIQIEMSNAEQGVGLAP